MGKELGPGCLSPIGGGIRVRKRKRVRSLQTPIPASLHLRLVWASRPAPESQMAWRERWRPGPSQLPVPLAKEISSKPTLWTCERRSLGKLVLVGEVFSNVEAVSRIVNDCCSKIKRGVGAGERLS